MEDYVEVLWFYDEDSDLQCEESDDFLEQDDGAQYSSFNLANALKYPNIRYKEKTFIVEKQFC